MALEDLTPVTRTEAILDGDDISPVTRMEYFLGKAANEVPKPEGVSDAGKVLTVNAAGDGFELDTPESELPAYTGADLGKVLTVGEGSGPETVVVVPEQTVTVDGGSANVPDFDFSNVSAGDSFTLAVNGVSYTGVAVESEVGIACIENTTAYEYTVVDLDDRAIFTGDGLSDGTYTISLTVSVPVVEPKWEDGGETYTLPAGILTTFQTVIGGVIQAILTNSTKTIVGDSMSYNGPDAADISDAIVNLADAYIAGKHVTVDIMGFKCVPIVLGKDSIGGALYGILPHYRITAPATKDFTVYIRLSSLSNDGVVTGINVYVGAQLWDNLH